MERYPLGETRFHFDNIPASDLNLRQQTVGTAPHSCVRKCHSMRGCDIECNTGRGCDREIPHRAERDSEQHIVRMMENAS